jgi:hypothetical protein
MSHGKGIYFYANGDSYEGYWAEDKREGKGTYRDKEGNIF